MTVKLQLQNKIINGSFDYFQRGVTFAAVAGGTYTADRFMYLKVGTMVHTVSQSSNVAADAVGVSSLLATPTTIQASILAGSNCMIGQRIEGNILRSFKSKKMVLTFKVRAFKTGVYCLSLRNNALDRSLVKEYTVNASNTWETKTVRFTHDASGTWVYNTGIGMSLNFVLAAGTTFQTTPDVWQTGNFLATSNQVNGVDNLSNTFQISDVCLVEDNDGATRVPEFQYAGRDVFEELQLCQRYCVTSFRSGITPANNLGLVQDGIKGWSTSLAGANANTFGVTYPVRMRVQPGISTYNLFNTTPNTFALSGGGANAFVNYDSSDTGWTMRNSATVLVGAQVNIGYLADAEL